MFRNRIQRSRRTRCYRSVTTKWKACQPKRWPGTRPLGSPNSACHARIAQRMHWMRGSRTSRIARERNIPDRTGGTKRKGKRVETYPLQRPRIEAASSPSPSSLRRDTSRRHRRYDIWVSQHQCRRDILQGWLSRTPLKWNSLVQGYRHTLYSAPLFPPGRGWGPFLAPSLSVPHSRLVRSHGHAPFDKPRLSTSLPSCERASSIRSTLARLLDSPSSDYRLPASFSGWKCNDRKRVSPRPCDESRSCQGRSIDHRSGQSGGWNGRAPRLRAHAFHFPFRVLPPPNHLPRRFLNSVLWITVGGLDEWFSKFN